MAVGWSPLGAYSDTILKLMPPSDFSGRGGRCGVNSGRLPETSGCAAIIGCWASTWRARSLRSCGLASSALSDAVMSSMLRDGGPEARRAGRVERARRGSGRAPGSPLPACGERASGEGRGTASHSLRALELAPAPHPIPLPALMERCGEVGVARGEGEAGRNGACDSAKPLEECLVSGVPPTPSRGGAGGLPDLPREARGRGVLSFGGRAMGDIWRARGQGATVKLAPPTGC